MGDADLTGCDAAQLSLEKWPAVAAYVKRMSERPACKTTVMEGVNSGDGK